MTSVVNELWQAYDERGEPLVGKGLTKPEARTGRLHAAAHVWIWRGQGTSAEILVQQRAKDKPTWPGLLDISAAGHIDLGETPLQAAVRETKEELGLGITAAQLRLLFVYRTRLKVEESDSIENEFQWVYGLRTNEPLTLAYDDEVEATSWLSFADFEQLAAGKLANKRIVPHGQEYFSMLLQEIRETGKIEL